MMSFKIVSINAIFFYIYIEIVFSSTYHLIPIPYGTNKGFNWVEHFCRTEEKHAQLGTVVLIDFFSANSATW